MKFKTRLISLLLVLVMLLPMVVACGDPSVENSPAKDKEPVAGELAALPEKTEKVDAKALLLELLKEAELDANMATVTVKFKGDINASFLDPDASYSTSDFVDYVDDDGYITIPVSSILEMFGDGNEVFGDIGNVLNNILLEFVSNGGYGSLEDMLGGVVDSLNIDVIAAQYGSVENYLSVVLVAQLIGAVITANEYNVHMYAGEMESLENCAIRIQGTVSYITDYMLKECKGENQFVNIIDLLNNSELLDILGDGCVCGLSNAGIETPGAVKYAVSNIAEDIEKYDAIYDGEGNYNLEVYYPAIANNIEYIFSAFIYSYVDTAYIALDYDYVIDALVEYLGTEDGPVANLDVCDILLTIGAAALSVVYTNEMVLESELEETYPEIGFYNLAEEKWYVFSEDYKLVPVEDETEVNILGYYHEYDCYECNALHYASSVSYDSPSPVMSYEEAMVGGAENVYAVYNVTLGDDVYVSYDETVNAVFDEMFDLLISGIGAEMTESDQLMVSAAMIAFTMTYPEQYNGKLMDQAFAERFIISVLSESVLDGADEALANVAALLGIVDEDDTDDNDPVQDFIDQWLQTVQIEEGEELTVEEYIISMIIEVLWVDSVRWELMNYYHPGFAEILSIYLAAKYLGDTETGDALFPGEELDDGLPVTVVVGLLGEYVRVNKLNYNYSDIYDFVLGYYDYKSTKIVNYEDIFALYVAIENEALYSIASYKYPFDYIEYLAMSMLLDGLMSNKFYVEGAESNADYQLASSVASTLLNKIYFIDGDSSANTSDILVDFIWVLLATDLGDEELSDMMDMFNDAVNTAMTDAEIELTTCSVDVALGYILEMLYTEVAQDSDRYIDFLLAKLLPGQTEDARVALADSIEGVIDEALVGFEGIQGLDNEVLVGLLSDISTLLSENGVDTTTLDKIVTDMGALDTELDVESLLDIILAESFADDDYVVLTDVILALMSGTNDDVLTAIAAAKTALADDIIAVGYLRALEAEINATEPDMDGMLNAVALMYLAEYHGEDVRAYIVPALHMTFDEFKAYFDFEAHYADVYAVRAWASKYMVLYNENGTFNAFEMAVDFLVASNYYEEGEIPTATDELYYEKLAVIYAANEYFCNDEYADAVVDVIFNPDNISLYGETFLELAESLEVTDRTTAVLKLAFYVLSTKGYLELDEKTPVEWDRVLAYIPEIYESFTGEKLEIANYKAFAEMLRPAFAEDVNVAFEATVVPYETATEVIYVFTVVGDLEHSAIDGDCELIIEIRVPKNA